MLETWSDDWNNIIRDIIFPDEELKRLMLVPQGTSILDFIGKYFIRAGYTNTLLEHDDVRVIYGFVSEGSAGTENTTNNVLSFDIYVKHEHLHDADRDRMRYRTELIARRLHKLLTAQRYNAGYRFWIDGEDDKGTRTTGYARYGLRLRFIKVY